MSVFGKATLAPCVTIAALSLAACRGQDKDTVADCTATYVKVTDGRALLFLVGCKEKLSALPPKSIAKLRAHLVNQETSSQASFLEALRKQAGPSYLTICLKRHNRLEVLDTNGSWSCLLSKGSEASAVLFGPKASMLSLDRIELAQVAEEIDRLVVAKGLGLLGETDRPSFRAGAAAKLNKALGSRTVDDVYLYSYRFSEDLP